MMPSPTSSLTSSNTSVQGIRSNASSKNHLQRIMEDDSSDTELDPRNDTASLPNSQPAQTDNVTDSVPLAKKHFESNNNRMNILLSMAIGIEDPSSPGTVFCDYNNHPSFPNKQKKIWNPLNSHLFDEIKRRKTIFSDMSITSTAMRRDGALTWLRENPIKNEEDKAFIVYKVSTFLKEVAAAKKEIRGNKASSAVGDANSTTSARQWSGMIPFLRLIHAICDFENIRSAFHKYFNVLTKDELDRMNRDDAVLTSPWTLASDKWNDPDFDCKSSIYADLHDEFSNEIDLSFVSVENMGSLTPDKAKQKFFKLKNDLVIVKSRYEKSGNGDGSVLVVEQNDDDSSQNSDEIDRDELQLMNANHKSRFLQDKSPATLYLWQKGDEFDLLTVFCQQLDSTVMLNSSGTNGSTRACSNDNNRDTLDSVNDDGLSGLKEMIANSNKQMEASNKQMDNSNKQLEAATRAKRESNCTARLDAERTRMYAVEDQVDDAEDGPRKRRLERRLEECEQRIAEFESELKKIRAESG